MVFPNKGRWQLWGTWKYWYIPNNNNEQLQSGVKLKL